MDIRSFRASIKAVGSAFGFTGAPAEDSIRGPNIVASGKFGSLQSRGENMPRGKKRAVGRREFLKGVAVGAGALAAVDTPGGKGGGTGARIPAPGRGGRSAADNRRGAYRRPHRLRFHGGRFQIAQPRVRVRGGRFEFPRAARIGGQLSRQQESRVHFVNMLSGQRPGARLFESSFHQMG